jgi:hypothetical protein
MRAFFLLFFSLLFFSAIGQQVTLTSTNLPLILIDTHGKNIANESKIVADMKIIYLGNNERNTPSTTPTIYNGKVGIEYRGHYSQSLPQKPYVFETLDMEGEEMNVSLFGFPKENDWILLANYNDKTFSRNPIAFELFRQMGHYASRTMLCELILNGEYQGIYTLTEKIKRDKNRVNIRGMDADDNAGDSLTGGYMFNVDYQEEKSWASNYSPLGYPKGIVRFNYVYPAPDVITEKQSNYLENHVDEFEKVLFGNNFEDKKTGYQAYIDVNSFVDYFIIGEVTRNVDAYKKSCFYYKLPDSKGGLIYAGPVWDFDWSMKNFYECFFQNTDGSGWAYDIFECYPDRIPPAWMIRLMSDPWFVNKVYDRYTSLRKTILSDKYIFNYIDSVENLVNEAQVRHYKKWPILGKNVGTQVVDFIPSTFAGEMEKLKDWLSLRLKWLDENMMGEPSSVDHVEVSDIKVFPNPVKDDIHIYSDMKMKEINILSLDGKIVFFYSGESENSFTYSVYDLASGIYFLKITLESSHVYFKKFIKTTDR